MTPLGKLEVPAPRPCGHGGNESGSILILALLATMILSVITISMSTNSNTELEISSNYHGAQVAFYAADGGIQSLFNEIANVTNTLARFPTTGELAGVNPPAPAGSYFTTVQAATVGPITNGPLTGGPYQGLNASTQIYEGTLTAEATSFPRSEATVSMRSMVDLIPIFQFAAFYEHDFEIHPGPVMNLTGRVHTNSDGWFASGSGLYFQANVTAVGDMHWGLKPTGNPQSNDVYFQDSSSTYVAMNGLDSAHPDWHDEALDRWDGNVKSAAHGVAPLELALPDPSTPHNLIIPGYDSDGPAEAITKLFYKSELRLLNDTATDAVGAPVSLIDPGTGESAVRYTVINDLREQHPMLTIEIDVGILANTPAWPTNGTVYIAAAEPGNGVPTWDGGWPAAWTGYVAPYNGGDTQFAVKLTNGSNLLAPLTVVTVNPAYIRGDYNSVNKKGAAVIADTITLLSNAWGRTNSGGAVPAGDPDDDWGYSNLPFAGRDASTTTYNVATMGGMTETTSSTVTSGGYHNLLRYMENWSGDSCNYNGSVVVLWYSVQAYSNMNCCGFVYNPPNRNYSFDTDFLDPANLPPSTPMALQIRVVSWSRD